MDPEESSAGSTELSPEEAFSVLGEETRLQILQVLGEAGRPLAFSDLFDRVEYEDPANFNYHIKQLLGHFVQRADDGYELGQAGHRVVEAVLSGAVTESPVLEPTEIDRPCQHCGAETVEIEYVDEQVGMYCTECSGQYGGSEGTDGEAVPAKRQRIGYVHLPPAGLDARTPEEVFDAGFRWTVMQAQTLHRGVCPRCSAAVDETVSVCEDHDPTDGLCERCDRRFAIAVHSQCTNCTFDLGGSLLGHLHTSPELLGFLFDHEIDPLSSPYPSTLEVADFEEQVLATDPLEARFTFDVDGDELVLTVDERLDVVDARRTRPSDDGR